MARASALTIADIGAHANELAVACTRCDLAKRHRVEKLIQRYGAQLSLSDLLRLLSVGCPMHEAVGAFPPCGIYWREFDGSSSEQR